MVRSEGIEPSPSVYETPALRPSELTAQNCEGFDDAYKRVSHFSNPYSAAGMRNLSRKFRKIYILTRTRK